MAQHLGTLRRLGRLDLIAAETEVAPGVTLLPAPGDSPGHHAVRVESGGERLYAVGDLFHHACEVQHPAWISPGRDLEASRQSRLRLSAAAAAEAATVVFTHEHVPPWGRIVAAPDGAAGYRWQRLP